MAKLHRNLYRNLYLYDPTLVNLRDFSNYYAAGAYLKNLVQLILLILAGEKSLQEHELTKNRAHRPHVNSGRVLFGAEQELGTPVPKCDHNGRVFLEGRAVLPRQAKVGDLYDPIVAEQKVGRLQIAVYDPVVVQVSDAAQHLPHQTLHLRHLEVFLHAMLHQALEVMLDKVHDHVDLVHVAADHNLAHRHHIDVLRLEESVHLSDGRDRKSFALLFHLESLQSDNLVRLLKILSNKLYQKH